MVLCSVPCEVTGYLLTQVPGLGVHNDGMDWRLVHCLSGYMLGSGPTSDVVLDMALEVQDLFDWEQPLLAIVQDLPRLREAARRIMAVWSEDWQRRVDLAAAAAERAKAKPKAKAQKKGQAEERQADVTTREAA